MKTKSAIETCAMELSSCLDALESLMAKATFGLWEPDIDEVEWTGKFYVFDGTEDGGTWDTYSTPNNQIVANVRWIAAIHNAAPGLIDALRTYRENEEEHYCGLGVAAERAAMMEPLGIDPNGTVSELICACRNIGIELTELRTMRQKLHKIR